MNKWSLNSKFIVILSIFILTSVVIATLSIFRMSQMREAINELVTVTGKRVVYAKDIDNLVTEIRLFEKVYILETTPEGMNQVGAKLDTIEQDVFKKFDDFSSIATALGKKDVDNMREYMREWKPVSLEVRKLGSSGKKAEASSLSLGKSGDILKKINSIVNSLVERNETWMAEEGKRSSEMAAKARNVIMLVSALALLIGLCLATFTLRALSTVIDQVISNLTDSSTQVSSAAQQIAASSEQLSSASSEQAASLQETASALEEVQSMIKKNTDNSQTAAKTAISSKSNALKGKETVEEMIRAIDAIESSNGTIVSEIERSNQQIGEIVQVISEIGNKTKVINDIVFQTKLLSFNASVEAARAGEHGKGFAVVAEEVGNLAQMSGNAAKEISEMLSGSIQKVEHIVNETRQNIGSLVQTGKEKVAVGNQIARQCGQVLDEIVHNVTSVSTMAEEISLASTEQTQGVSEINNSMAQLDQVTQQNAGATQETASAAEELSAQADSLGGVVSLLVSTIKGEAFALTMKTADGTIRTRRASKHQPIKASAPASKNVIPLKPSVSAVKPSARSASESKVKKVAGGDGVPYQDDPRFEDV